jgi:EpsI family protein
VDAGLWTRVAVACALLIGSAGVRAWQARRIESTLAEGLRHKIELAALPLALGPWKGEPTQVDEQIARATGADEIVTRRYVNQSTGVAVEVILLYGPAVDMYVHIPELCYPAAGFTLLSGPEAKTVETQGLRLPFRSLVYAKGEGAQADLQEVYYTWRYNGRWTPEVGKQKHFERIPSMYKVHVARRVSERERRDVGNPCEAFLRELLPEIERRITASQTPTS